MPELGISRCDIKAMGSQFAYKSKSKAYFPMIIGEKSHFHDFLLFYFYLFIFLLLICGSHLDKNDKGTNSTIISQ